MGFGYSKNTSKLKRLEDVVRERVIKLLPQEVLSLLSARIPEMARAGVCATHYMSLYIGCCELSFFREKGFSWTRHPWLFLQGLCLCLQICSLHR